MIKCIFLSIKFIFLGLIAYATHKIINLFVSNAILKNRPLTSPIVCNLSRFYGKICNKCSEIEAVIVQFLFYSRIS